MTKKKDILKLEKVTSNKDLMCRKVKTLKDFYRTPLKSSLLNIFEGSYELDTLAAYKVSDIKCKLFAFVFFPLLHSYNDM